MSQLLDIAKIRVLIYRLDIYNLQTKIVPFQDQEKLLQEVVFSLAVSMNANTKNSQIKHYPYPKYVVIKKPNLNNLQTRKKIWKMTECENLSFKICQHKKPRISTLPKNLRWSELRCMVRIKMQTRLLQFKDQKKAQNIKPQI